MPFSKNRFMKLAGLLNEHMRGGTSSSFKNPGHLAKLNQANELERALEEDIEALEEGIDALDWLASGKLHKVNLEDAKEKLIALAYETVNNLENMHLPKSGDRKTEKMTKQKLARVYDYLNRLNKLSN